MPERWDEQHCVGGRGAVANQLQQEASENNDDDNKASIGKHRLFRRRREANFA